MQGTIVCGVADTAEGRRALELAAELSERLGLRLVLAHVADGSLDENPGLFDTLAEQAQLERRVALLEERLAAAQIAEPNGDGSADVGSFVLLRDLETGELVEFELVGALEGDAAQGRVSVDAPVGQALVGAAAGEVVSVRCPRREIRFEVLGIEAAPRAAPVRMAA